MPTIADTYSELARDATLIALNVSQTLTDARTKMLLGPTETLALELHDAPLLYVQKILRTIKSAVNLTTDLTDREHLILHYKQLDDLLLQYQIKIFS